MPAGVVIDHVAIEIDTMTLDCRASASRTIFEGRALNLQQAARVPRRWQRKDYRKHR
jgi:hypothetical protein